MARVTSSVASPIAATANARTSGWSASSSAVAETHAVGGAASGVVSCSGVVAASPVVMGFEIEEPRRSHQPVRSARLHLPQPVHQPLDAAAGEGLDALAGAEDLIERQHVELGDPGMRALEGDEPTLVEQHLAEPHVAPLAVGRQE